MAKDTKERILEAALRLFSEKGYSGTNIQEIADEVGIVKSALYRHFESKEAIFTAILGKVNYYYSVHMGSSDNLPSIPCTGEQLRELTLGMVNFTMHDEIIRRMRKILHIEQFRDERIRDIATEYFLNSAAAIFERIFSRMIDEGTMAKNDPAILAFAYTTPITALIHLCDRDPGKEAEAMKKADSFIGFFIKSYVVNPS